MGKRGGKRGGKRAMRGGAVSGGGATMALAVVLLVAAVVWAVWAYWPAGAKEGFVDYSKTQNVNGSIYTPVLRVGQMNVRHCSRTSGNGPTQIALSDAGLCYISTAPPAAGKATGGPSPVTSPGTSPVPQAVNLSSLTNEVKNELKNKLGSLGPQKDGKNKNNFADGPLGWLQQEIMNKCSNTLNKACANTLVTTYGGSTLKSCPITLRYLQGLK